MSITLGLSTGQTPMSFSLFDSHRLVVEHRFAANYADSEGLVDRIQHHLMHYSLSFSDITQCVWIDGPGSYTGLRIGATFLNMLNLSQSLTLHTIQPWQAYACSVPVGEALYGIVLPGRRGYLSFQLIHVQNGVLRPVSEGAMIAYIDFSDLVIRQMPHVQFYGAFSNQTFESLKIGEIPYHHVSLDFNLVMTAFFQSKVSAIQSDEIHPNYLGEAVNS